MLTFGLGLLLIINDSVPPCTGFCFNVAPPLFPTFDLAFRLAPF
jgi:hypothetical protein